MVTQEELCICYTVNFFPIQVKSINCAFLLQVGLYFIGSIERIKFCRNLISKQLELASELELTSKFESSGRGLCLVSRLFSLPKIVFSFAYAKCNIASVSSCKTG